MQPFYLVIGIFLIILAILWFILPFAIFGTKPKLDELIAEQRHTNALLKKLLAEKTTKGATTDVAP